MLREEAYSAAVAAAAVAAAVAAFPRGFFSFSGAGIGSSTPAKIRPQCSQTINFFLSLMSV